MDVKLLSYRTGQGGTPRAGLLVDGRVIDLAGALGASDGIDPASVYSLLQAWPQIQSRLDAIAGKADSAKSLALGDVTLTAPILYPGNIYCAAANYQDHFREMSGKDIDKTSIKPYFFLKLARQTVIGPGEAIRRPKITQKLDWEAEIGVVIGRSGRNISPERALDHVAGYTIINDLSARDYIRRADWPNMASDWLWQKSFDTSAPMGPWITLARDVPDPQNLFLKTWVNGAIEQDSHSKYMVFTVREQIAALSEHFTLLPGDVIATGTGSGVGHPKQKYLKPGDTCRIEIERLGSIENPIMDGE
jgi:2-keto-4-pentenoate hydratase/2-oxohepta-3-ene-1,7-dioic acid hydratase in catechol pathway